MPETISHRPQQEMFGVSAGPLVDVIDSADSLALLGRKSLLPMGVYRENLQTAADVWPLVKAVRRGREVTPQDVRPHADDILDNIVTNPAVYDAVARRGDRSTARRLRLLGQFSGVGFVRDQALPRVEREFPGKVKEFLDSPDTRRHVEYGLEVARPYAEAISDYDDPRGQYLRELDTLTDEIRNHTREARDARLAVEYARRPAHTFRGKLLRWRHRRKDPDQLIKPIDAAHGIDHVIRKTLGESVETTRIPMFRSIIETALTESPRAAKQTVPLPPISETLQPWDRESLNQAMDRVEAREKLRLESTKPKPRPLSIHTLTEKIPRLHVLEAVAPEIMQMLEAPLAENRQDPRFLKSIKKRFSFKAKLGRFFKGSDIRALGYRGERFLTAARDVLPRSGREVTTAMDEIREFFLT